jgi:hypothetical protein
MRKPFFPAPDTAWCMEHSITHALDELLPSDADRDTARMIPRPIWRIFRVSRSREGAIERVLHLGFYSEAECDEAMDAIKERKNPP